MPRQGYVPTFRPQTQAGGALANIAQAFFAAQGAQQDSDNQQFRNDAYTANAEQSRASAEKAIAETLGINNQEAAINKLDPALQGMSRNTNGEQLAKALQQLTESSVYDSLTGSVNNANDFARLQAANKGNAMVDKGANNVMFVRFTGALFNEDNDLNQANIVNELSQANENESTVSLNRKKEGTEKAQATKYYADADKASRDTGSSSLAETYIGDDANGNPVYQTVPKAAGTQITKPKTKGAADKNYAVSMTDGADFSAAIDDMFAGQVVDKKAKVAIINKASQIAQKTGNKPMALQEAIQELTGGQGLVGLPITTTFNKKVRPSEKTLTLPKSGQPKQQTVKPASIPQGWTVQEVN